MKKCLKISCFLKPCIVAVAMTLPWAINANTPATSLLSSNSISQTSDYEVTDVTNIVTESPSDFLAYNYLSTNSLEWTLAIANIAWELDLAPHWSVNIPVALSAWDYFTSTVKFRVASINPEMRYWFTPARRFYLGAHIGVTFFNIALNGDYRYQDTDGKTPAIGGGIAAGYRLPLSADRRWWLELSLGVGFYHINYDKFVNQNNGEYYHSHSRNYLGPDQLGVKFIYRFNTFSVH